MVAKKKKREKLPHVRPCVKCGQEKPIAVRGMCDACRKREERAQDALTHPAFGRKEQQESGTELLARLLRILNKAQVPRASREIVLENVVPYLGYSGETQRHLISDLLGPKSELSYGRTDNKLPSVHPHKAKR